MAASIASADRFRRTFVTPEGVDLRPAKMEVQVIGVEDRQLDGTRLGGAASE